MEIDQQKLTAALLVDNLLIANYQKQALINAIELLDIKIIINCQNTFRKTNSLKQFLYYFLNLFSIKNYMSKPTSLPDELNGVEIINLSKNAELRRQKAKKYGVSVKLSEGTEPARFPSTR